MTDYAPLELDEVQAHRHWAKRTLAFITIVREETHAVFHPDTAFADEVVLRYAAAMLTPMPAPVDMAGYAKALREAIHGPDDESEDT
jgi:hypothetical protein